MLKAIASNFSAIFNRPEYNNKPIDGLRAIAIIYVVFFHAFFFTQYAFAEKSEFLTFIEALPFWMNWVWQGDKGVDIFFVISGFLIAQHLMQEFRQRNRIDLKGYYLKRAIRILPLYLFAIVLFAPTGKNLEYVWANLLFVNNFITVENIYIPWSWSLTVEIQFYLLMPFLVILLYRTGRPVLTLLLLFVAANLLRLGMLAADPSLYQVTLIDMFLTENEAAAVNYLDTLYVNLYSRCGPLLLGVLVASIDIQYGALLRDYFGRKHVVLSGLFLFSVALMVGVTLLPVYVASSSPGYDATLHYLYLALGRNLFALGVALFMMTALYRAGLGGMAYRFLAARFWFPVSQTSYAIYLFHIPFLFVAFYLLQGAEPLHEIMYLEIVLIALLGLFFSMLFASLTFALLERPALRWGRGRMNRQ